jgi:hypothetical protein
MLHEPVSSHIPIQGSVLTDSATKTVRCGGCPKTSYIHRSIQSKRLIVHELAEVRTKRLADSVFESRVWPT